MSEVTEVAGYINPINGDDSTGLPDDPEFPYKTIDGFYTQQRGINTGILTAKVQTGNVFLGIQEYLDFQIIDVAGSPTDGALLSIYGSKGKSIHLKQTLWQINTMITLEADPYDGSMDIPVFVVDEGFDFGPNYSLNIDEENADFTKPNKSRDIFNLDGSITPVNICIVSQSRSNIKMNRIGAIFYGGLLFSSNTFEFQEKFPSSNFYQASNNSIFASISADEFSTRLYHQFPEDFKKIEGKRPLLGGSCNTIGECVLLSGLVTLTAGLAIAFAAVQGKNFVKDLTKPICTTLTFPKSSHPTVIAKTLEVKKRLTQELPLITVINGSISSSEDGTAIFTDIEDIQINNLNLQGVKPFMDVSTETKAVFNLQQEFNSQFFSGSIFMRPVLITTNFTHEQFDGEVFIIDATNNDITITIPIGDISRGRTFEYKRLDKSSHRVIITSPGLIDGLPQIRLSNRKCKISSIKLYGYNDKILVLNYSSSLNPILNH